MKNGIFGFKSDRTIKKESKTVVNNIGLQVYEIPPADYSASPSTINLPSNGEWLLVGRVLLNFASEGSFSINGEPVIRNRPSENSYFSFCKKIDSSSFLCAYNIFVTISEFHAIKISGN